MISPLSRLGFLNLLFAILSPASGEKIPGNWKTMWKSCTNMEYDHVQYLQHREEGYARK